MPYYLVDKHQSLIIRNWNIQTASELLKNKLYLPFVIFQGWFLSTEVSSSSMFLSFQQGQLDLKAKWIT